MCFSGPNYSKYADTEEPVGPHSHQSKSFKFLQNTLDSGQGKRRQLHYLTVTSLNPLNSFKIHLIVDKVREDNSTTSQSPV